MISVSGRSPISSVKVLTLPASARHVTDPQKYAEMMKQEEELERRAQEVREGGPRRIAEQRAIKVHTVFKVGGKVVGIIHRNGWSTFASNGIGGAGSVHDLAARRGLTREGLNDLLADHYTTRLRRMYGTGLQVERYEDAASAPTSGEVEDLMFGRATGRLSRVV